MAACVLLMVLRCGMWYVGWLVLVGCSAEAVASRPCAFPVLRCLLLLLFLASSSSSSSSQPKRRIRFSLVTPDGAVTVEPVEEITDAETGPPQHHQSEHTQIAPPFTAAAPTTTNTSTAVR